jgi:hypothetical protein
MDRITAFTALRRIIGAGIISSAAVLAACSDSPTAPPAAALPGGANALTVGTGPRTLAAYVTARLADTLGVTVKEIAWVDVATSNPSTTKAVLDNSTDDLDPTVGYIKVKVDKSQSYQVCFDKSLSLTGDRWGNTFKACSASIASSASTVSAGVVYGKRNPQIVMLAKNEFGALVGGAKYSFETPEWVNPTIAYEGGGFDRNATVGNFTFDYIRYPHQSMKVCEVTPPPKHLLTSTQCFTFPVKFGGITTLTFNHEQVLY